MPNVICAPDKFRESATAHAAATAMVAGAREAGWNAVAQPVADGGEGSLEAVQSRQGGTIHRVRTVDALGRPVDAPYLLVEDGTAVTVAADVVGLAPLAAAERDPEAASSRGLAAVLLAAVAAGAERLVVFIGGVATVDGGLGLLAGLGADPRDEHGNALSGNGRDLYRLAQLRVERAVEALGGVELVVATDVRSPLLGPAGAARVYGPQKGAGPEVIDRLEHGLTKLAPLLGRAADQPGAGAAGGLGAALMALGAAQQPGAEAVLDLLRFDDCLAEADLCVTGEGRVDGSTLQGKAVLAVLAACARASVPCVVLGGTVLAESDALYEHGAAAVLAIGRQPREFADALTATPDDLRRATRAACTLRGWSA